MRVIEVCAVAICWAAWTTLSAATPAPHTEPPRHDAAAQAAQVSPAAARPPNCDASTAKQAGLRADQLYEKGLYQGAGECYLAAGESSLADRAFLKSVAPATSATARQLSVERDQARAQFQRLKASLHSMHRRRR